MAESKPIKVCLTNKGEDTETPWAHDLGPAPGTAPAGSRVVKLVNVPFMHAKPTWGDTIIVSPAGDEQPLTWDRGGTPWKQIGTRIVDDGGRWAMIVDYAPHTGADVNEAFQALTRACEGQRVVCEGAWAPREGEPGRAYFAVPKELSAEKLMDILRAATLPLDLIQIHPEPKAATGTSKKIKAGAVPVEKLAEPAAVSDTSPTTRARKADAKPSGKSAPKAASAKAVAKAAPVKTATAPTKRAAKTAPTKPPAKPPAKTPARAKAAPAKAAPIKAAAKTAATKARPAKLNPAAKKAASSKAAKKK